MAIKIKALFQNTLNFFSRKPDNMQLVSRAKQYSGEYAKELPYSRFYDYFHQHPSVKRNINSIHTRWMGSSIEVQSQSSEFDQLWQLWADTIHFFPKLKEWALDTLITGTGLMEKQFFGKVFANLEHIPTKTLWRMFRDEFAKVLSIWQMVDGDIKEIAPSHVIIMTINNPERDAVGKSEMYAVAVPQKVAGKVDELGNPINPERYLPSILDIKARLNFAHMEIAEKQAKSRWFVSLRNVKDTKRQQDIEKDLENESSSKYITVTDGEVTGTEISFNKQVGNERYLDDIDTQINQASGYPGNVIDKGEAMGYASSQTPIQELAQKIQDMQNNLSSIIEAQVFKPLCEQWGLDFDEVQPKLIFNTFVEKVTFEQLIKIPPTAPLAPEELRSAYREWIPGMDDQLWEEHAEKMEQQREEEMKMQVAGKTKDETDKKNPRPDIETDRPKPDSMEYLLKNPSKFNEYLKELVSKYAKEAYTYFAFPPIDGEPYTAPDADITNPEILERIKKMLQDVKDGIIEPDELEKEVERLGKESHDTSYWISELKKSHPEWKHDQVVAVAIKKVKAGEQANPHDYIAVKGFGETKCRICGLPMNDWVHMRESATATGKPRRKIPEKQYKDLKAAAEASATEPPLSKEAIMISKVQAELVSAQESFKAQLISVQKQFEDKLSRQSAEAVEMSLADKRKIKSMEKQLSDFKEEIDVSSLEADILQKKSALLSRLQKKIEKMRFND